MTTRLSKTGNAGQPTTTSNRGDYALETVTALATVVASASTQTTTTDVPTGMTLSVFLNITSPETVAVAKTINVGTVAGGATFYGTAIDVSSAGMVLVSSNDAVSADTVLTYTLGGADFSDLNAEIVLLSIGSFV